MDIGSTAAASERAVPPVPPAVAFFDVDETLIRAKSMFGFLRFYLRQVRNEPPGTYQRLAAGLRAAADRGVPREEINRRYYRLLAGENTAQLERAGRAWFASQPVDARYIGATVVELRRHQAAGAVVVLLSGSFFACLAPIAEPLGVRWVLGTRPVVRRGVLTGEVLAPMIGPRKGRAAELAAAVLSVPLAACSAYADHASDLPLLTAVGDPVVVGTDQVLAAHASRGNWRRILPYQRPPEAR